jgi:hypothetical protein
MTHPEIFSEAKCEDLRSVPISPIFPRMGRLQATRIALSS